MKGHVLTTRSRHAVLLTVQPGDLVAVKTGFRSGYPGEGPRGLSRVLCLLDGHGVDIEEFEVEESLLDRLDESALTMADIDLLGGLRPIRPQRWRDYLDEGGWGTGTLARLWQDAPAVIPFAIVDDRIMDLATTFWSGPDERLLTGYRRLEDIVRKRTAIDNHGYGLFSAVFLATPPALVWKECSANEQKGRAQLFVGAYMAYRNPRAHQELKGTKSGLLSEFLLLNHLYTLESAAV